MDLGLGAEGDLPLPSANSDSSDMISVPGEGTVVDEMVALQQPPPVAQQPRRSQPLLSTRPKPVMALAKVQSMAGASPESGFAPGSFADTPQTVPQPPVPTKEKVVEEYDVDSDDEDDDYRTTKMTETKTREELEREQRGDVEHVKPVEQKKPKPLIRRLKLAAEAQQTSKVSVKEEKTEVDVAEQAPGDDKMMGQCMAFASWVKGQGSTGPDLVRIWKGTCMPSVMAGDAPPAYGNMCNALGTAVSKFAVKPWAPAEMCQAVLAVFRESGVGATPLR